MDGDSALIESAAGEIRKARTLIVTAGAGMGVDSGLPDFRGNEGFWKAYPPYRKLGLSFVAAANPAQFSRDPGFAWGFYGHRLNLYRKTIPHAGFAIIEEWVQRFSLDRFVVTSNVDGQFQKAGFPPDGIFEVHGSLLFLQCLTPCTPHIWPASDEGIPVDEATMRANHFPRCPACNGPARPNVLMFGDSAWLGGRSDDQERRFDGFLRSRAQSGGLVVLECGAGTAIPTIRLMGERIVAQLHGTLIRINPRDCEVPKGHISVRSGAFEGLRRIQEAL